MAKARETQEKATPKPRAKAAPKPKADAAKKDDGHAESIRAMAVADARANPTRVVGTGSGKPSGDGPVLERGDIFFFYRPDVDDEAPSSLTDVRRFHIVLRPADSDTVRMITVGRKTLPGSGEGGGNYWAFVDRVFPKPEDIRAYLGEATYETETQGERTLPAARPVGEGVYALARHAQGTVLAYVLELPQHVGEVQDAFGIEAQGRFVVSLKNPNVGSPSGLGLDDDRKADLPRELAAKFGARKWLPAEPPSFLDHEGVEMVLIGGRIDPDDDLGLELEPQPEDEENAEVFRDLHIDRTERSLRPLFEGEWA
ncbi:hypothetical protein TA3x_001485 [Tundrisphaera sp. TA3]|uniref:hypothetical protein n=1 Tax=Tundrisphaera sp. TA3 TaxID=3435775 RepID=UPI003EB8A37A